MSPIFGIARGYGCMIQDIEMGILKTWRWQFWFWKITAVSFSVKYIDKPFKKQIPIKYKSLPALINWLCTTEEYRIFSHVFQQ